MKAKQGLPRRRGPRTPEGLERSRRANWKHGYYSREAKAERSRAALAASVASWISLTSFSGLLTLWKSAARASGQPGRATSTGRVTVTPAKSAG
jgi:hypothetical protein